MSRRLAFVDHSFHRTSGCTSDLKVLLATRYRLTEFWDESWAGGERVDYRLLRDGDFDVVVFFQTLLPPLELALIGCRSLVWMPMLDDAVSRSRRFFAACSNLTTISFSRTLHDYLVSAGFRSWHFQYWVDPATVPTVPRGDLPRVFFWQRTPALDLERDVLPLFSGTRTADFWFRNTPDPGWPPASVRAETLARSRIEPLDGFFESRDAYLRLVSQANVFVAPRLFEGIGMAFLEAMAMGLCVVAADRPSMNEYIVDGETGLLFEPSRPAGLDFRNLGEIQRRARERAAEGHRRWEARQAELLDVLDAAPRSRLPFRMGGVLSVLRAGPDRLRRMAEDRRRSPGRVAPPESLEGQPGAAR